MLHDSSGQAERTGWVVFADATSNGTDTLLFVREQLAHIAKGDQFGWRWLIIGTHQALHDFLVAAVPNALWTSQRKAAAEFVQGMQDGLPAVELPELSVVDLEGLFKAVKRYAGWRPTPAQRAALLPNRARSNLNLQSLRNEVVHRSDGSLSVPAVDILRLVDTGLDVVEHLGWKLAYTNHSYWPDPALADAAWAALASCRADMQLLRQIS